MSDPRATALVALRIGVAMLLVAGVGAIAHLPLGAPPDHAALRIALRTPLAQIEVCRDRSDEELAALPRHMRQRRDCAITTVDYRLTVEVDDRVLVDRVVVHRGVRRNRPLVADELLTVAPGSRRVVVRFAPEATQATIDGGAELATARFDNTLELVAGRVSILALAADGGSFLLSK